jgi:hypothetical protein
MLPTHAPWLPVHISLMLADGVLRQPASVPTTHPPPTHSHAYLCPAYLEGVSDPGGEQLHGRLLGLVTPRVRLVLSPGLHEGSHMYTTQSMVFYSCEQTD